MTDAFLIFLASDLLNLPLFKMLLHSTQVTILISFSEVCSCKHNCRKLGSQRSVTCSKVFRHERGNQRAYARGGLFSISMNGSWTPWYFLQYA